MTMTWEIAVAMVTIISILGGVAVKWITTTVEQEAKARANSAQAIINNQTDLKDDLKQLHEGFEKRVDRLERETRDFRPGNTIDAAIDHSKRNVLTVVESVRSNGDKNTLAVESLRDRVTVLETKHGTMSITVNEIKSELKDTRHEMQAGFDASSKEMRALFAELATSIREIRKPPEAK